MRTSGEQCKFNCLFHEGFFNEQFQDQINNINQLFQNVNVDQNIVEVDEYRDTYQKDKHEFPEPLKSGRGIANTYKHHVINVNSIMLQECGF